LVKQLSPHFAKLGSPQGEDRPEILWRFNTTGTSLSHAAFGLGPLLAVGEAMAFLIVAGIAQ
jgi:hypothetical protein